MRRTNLQQNYFVLIFKTACVMRIPCQELKPGTQLLLHITFIEHIVQSLADGIGAKKTK